MRRVLVFGVAVLTGLTIQAGDNPLAQTRSALEQWVQARQMVGQSQVDWTAEKETLEASLAMFEKEFADLAARLEELGEGNAEVDRERRTLEAERTELDQLREVARLKAVELERRLPLLIRQLPEVLVERLKPLTERLPADSSDTRMAPTERMQALVGMLNEIDKFGSSISVESEIRQTPDGKEVEVQTLYLGLAQAYFVGEGGRFAGVGVPSADGWQWSSQEGAASRIRKAIAVYRSQQPPAFVQLPVSMQ